MSRGSGPSSAVLNGKTGQRDWPWLIALFTLISAPAIFAATSWIIPPEAMHFALPMVIAELVLAICCVLSGADIDRARRQIPKGIAVALGVFAACAISGSVFVASIPIDAILHFAITALHFCMGICLWASFQSTWSGRQEKLLVALLLGMIVYCLVTFMLMAMATKVRGFDWVYFRAGTTHVRQLGFYSLTLSGLACGIVATSSSFAGRVGAACAACLGFTLGDLSGGRATFAASICAAIVVCLLAPRSTRAKAASYISASFVLAMPLSFIFVPHYQWGLKWMFDKLFGIEGKADFASGRLELWAATIKGIAKSPVVGHGEGQFIVEVSRSLWSHPHNAILQFLYQWGVAGTLAIAIVLLRYGGHVWRGHGTTSSISLPAAGALTGLILMSGLEGSLYHVFPVMVVFICLASLAIPYNQGPAVAKQFDGALA